MPFSCSPLPYSGTRHACNRKCAVPAVACYNPIPNKTMAEEKRLSYLRGLEAQECGANIYLALVGVV